MLEVQCPRCKGHLFWDDIDHLHSATADCPRCNLLLLIKDDVAFDFHGRMHEDIPAWPADGKGTAYTVLIKE
jgi:hypothetical protein